MWFSALFQRRRPRLDHLTVHFYTRRGCHLCDEAWALLEEVRGRFGFMLTAVNVDTNPELAKQYADSRYVSVMPLDNAATKTGTLEPEALNETNMLVLYVFGSDQHRQAVLVARLDNLGKGASGAAVQNMRLMLGLD